MSDHIDAGSSIQKIPHRFISHYTTPDGKHLDEPYEQLEKLRALLQLITAAQDNKDSSLGISEEKLTWVVLLALDLIDDIESRTLAVDKNTSNIIDNLSLKLGLIANSATN